MVNDRFPPDARYGFERVDAVNNGAGEAGPRESGKHRNLT
jgi:hypothetical protein